MKLAQKPGQEAVYKFNVNELRGTAMLSKLRQLAKTAHQEDSPPKKSAAGFLRPSTGAGKLPGTLPGSIQSPIGPNRVGQGRTNFRQAQLPNYNDYNYGNQAKNPSSYNDYSPNAAYDDNNYEAGTDYSDDEGEKNEASGDLMEKFSKFKPTRPKDGVLHMKLAQKPGEETVYKFNVKELRQLAKTAHQVDTKRK